MFCKSQASSIQIFTFNIWNKTSLTLFSVSGNALKDYLPRPSHERLWIWCRCTPHHVLSASKCEIIKIKFQPRGWIVSTPVHLPLGSPQRLCALLHYSSTLYRGSVAELCQLEWGLSRGWLSPVWVLSFYQVTTCVNVKLKWKFLEIMIQLWEIKN